MRVLLSQLNKVYVGTKSLSNECNPFFFALPIWSCTVGPDRFRYRKVGG